MKIKNVIFDIGNVIVKWIPQHVIINRIFPEIDSIELFSKMRPLWHELNKGKLTEKEAIDLYSKELSLEKKKIQELMDNFKTCQTPLPGSIELLQKLSEIKSINLYAITDSFRETIQYHEENSNFLHYFRDVIASANVGVPKPDPRIYQYLMNKYQLNPAESLFIDDMERNIVGARNVGMQALLFHDAQSCSEELVKLGVIR